MTFMLIAITACNTDSSSSFITSRPAVGLSCNVWDLSANPPTVLPSFNPSGNSQAIVSGQEIVGVPTATYTITGPINFLTQATMLAGSGLTLTVNYALDCKGYFTSNVEQVYELTLNSDDGSQLLIDGFSIIDNDGEHAETSKSANIAATQGQHSIELQYFQGPGVVALQLFSNIGMEFYQ